MNNFEISYRRITGLFHIRIPNPTYAPGHWILMHQMASRIVSCKGIQMLRRYLQPAERITETESA